MGSFLKPARAAVAWSMVFATIAGVMAGCSPDARNPFASFETRCGALPPARIEIVAVPLEVAEDDTQDVAALTTRSKADPARHRTYGLTTVSFGHSTQSELSMLEDRGNGRACGTPKVHVELTMQPAVVLLARELAGQGCERDATREHEMRHVAVYRAVLGEAEQRLHAELPQAIGTGLRIAPSIAELKRRFDADLRAYLARFMSEEQADMTARQAAIDTPEEYARVARACGVS
jgi:hypothetical protein